MDIAFCGIFVMLEDVFNEKKRIYIVFVCDEARFSPI